MSSLFDNEERSVHVVLGIMDYASFETHIQLIRNALARVGYVYQLDAATKAFCIQGCHVRLSFELPLPDLRVAVAGTKVMTQYPLDQQKMEKSLEAIGYKYAKVSVKYPGESCEEPEIEDAMMSREQFVEKQIWKYTFAENCFTAKLFPDYEGIQSEDNFHSVFVNVHSRFVYQPENYAVLQDCIVPGIFVSGLDAKWKFLSRFKEEALVEALRPALPRGLECLSLPPVIADLQVCPEDIGFALPDGGVGWKRKPMV